MKLKMIRGKETSLVIEEVLSAIQEESFLMESYLKALSAICEYLENSKEITRELREAVSRGFSTRNNIIYRSAYNIIALSGRRGSGKSSAMLSLSDFLNNKKSIEEFCKYQELELENKNKYASLEGKRFLVLDPIDPTTLEKNQSILSVVLSRLLNKAEEGWNSNAEFYRRYEDKENLKTNLLYMARKCLNGINAIKSQNSIPGDLADLQKVGDSSVLKLNIYDFVNEVLRLSGNGRRDFSEESVLVLQIDDTDCQIEQGYEVLEDIRKYLTIPNVIILMATDIKLLRKVTIQHYVDSFKKDLEKEIIHKEEIKKLGERYMAKLLPASQVVYMPNIDHLIRDQSDSLYLEYYKDRECKELFENMLQDPKKQFDLQTYLLRYIYKKTHLVFTSHKAYLNNIVPTTLRGLGHLLGLLGSMEDIPPVNPEDDFSSFLQQVSEQLRVLEKNLSIFEDYFMGEWVPIKLSYETIKILEDFNEQVPSQRIPFLIKRISDYYRGKNREDFLASYVDFNINSVKSSSVSYKDLEDLLRTIQGTKKSSTLKESNRDLEDFYFIFAVRTLFSIKNSRDSVKIKRNCLNQTSIADEKIVFNFLDGKNSIPTNFYLEPLKLYDCDVVADKISKIDENECFSDDKEEKWFFWIDESGMITFNFTGAIIRWLSPSDRLIRPRDKESIYQAQEYALMIALNFEVQEKIRKRLVQEERNQPNNRHSNLLFLNVINKILNLIYQEVCEINDGMLEYGSGIDDILISDKHTRKVLEKIDKEIKKSNKKENDKGYDRFVYELSSKKNDDRINLFKSEKQRWCDSIRSILKEKNKLSEEIEGNLKKVESFEPQYNEESLQCTNKKEFEDLLENLYRSLDEVLEKKEKKD